MIWLPHSITEQAQEGVILVGGLIATRETSRPIDLGVWCCGLPADFTWQDSFLVFLATCRQCNREYEVRLEARGPIKAVRTP